MGNRKNQYKSLYYMGQIVLVVLISIMLLFLSKYNYLCSLYNMYN